MINLTRAIKEVLEAEIYERDDEKVWEISGLGQYNDDEDPYYYYDIGNLSIDPRDLPEGYSCLYFNTTAKTAVKIGDEFVKKGFIPLTLGPSREDSRYNVIAYFLPAKDVSNVKLIPESCCFFEYYDWREHKTMQRSLTLTKVKNKWKATIGKWK